MREAPTTIWQEVTLGQLAKGFRGVSYRPENLLGYPSDSAVTLLRATNIQQGNLTFDDVQLVPKWLVSPTQILEAGDIAVCMSNGSKTLVGKCASYQRSEKDTYTVGAFCSIFKPVDAIDAEFIFHLFRSQAYQKNIDVVLAGSAINNLKNSSIESAVFKIPVDKKQRQKIAAILTSIDTAIERTEVLIAKYQQIKAGLMHDLFTRGVLPNGQLRPSREQAPELYQETKIGWMPREWSVIHLGNMANIVSGVTLGAKAGPTDTIEAPYLRVANVQDGYLELTEVKTVRISPKTLEQLRLEPGDVLMNEGGDFDKLGRGAVWKGELENCVHQNHVFRVRCDAAMLLSSYLAFYSESAFGKKYFVMSSKQSTNLASINSTQLKAYPIAIPKLEEQNVIVQNILRVKNRLATLRAGADSLRAQKLGLMQDLLTGKVQVKIKDKETEPA